MEVVAIGNENSDGGEAVMQRVTQEQVVSLSWIAMVVCLAINSCRAALWALNNEALSQYDVISAALLFALNAAFLAYIAKSLADIAPRTWFKPIEASRLVATPPGSRLRRMAGFLFSRTTNERIFDALLADMEAEYIHALAKGHWHQASWIRCRETARFWLVVCVTIADSTFGRCVRQFWNVK